MGLCQKHYARQWRNGTLDLKYTGDRRTHPLYMVWWERKERSSLCAEWAGDFLAFVAAVGDRPSPTHLLRRLRAGPYGPDNFEWLAALKREPDESRKAFAARKWANRRERFPDYEAHRSIKRKYGITPERYAEMDKAQGGVCAICRQPETRISPKTHAPQALAVDHCHAGKHVRGLLCWRCNTMLGKVGDSTPILRAMIAYLEHGVGDVL